MEMHMNDTYDLYDAAYGVVTCCSRSGAYLTLDNGEDAFAYKAANLRPGTKVLCSVTRLAKPDRGWLKLVCIESVRYASPLAA